MLTSRVEGRGDSLILVNLIRAAIIPISVIAKVDRANGVHAVPLPQCTCLLKI